jgi:hypothetical protein
MSRRFLLIASICLCAVFLLIAYTNSPSVSVTTSGQSERRLDGDPSLAELATDREERISTIQRTGRQHPALEHPEQLPRILASLSTQLDRQGCLFYLGGAAARDNRADLLKVVEEQLSASERAIFFGAYATELSRIRVRDAAEVVANMPPSEQRTAAAVQVAARFAVTDLAGAIDWMNSNLNEAEKQMAASNMLFHLREIKDDLGLEIVLPLLEKGWERTSVIRNITAYKVQKGDTIGLEEFIQSLSPEDQRVATAQIPLSQARNLDEKPVSVKQELPSSDPLPIVSPLGTESPSEMFALSEGILREFRVDPLKTANRVAAMDEKTRNDALAILVGHWISTDVNGLVNWINSLPAGKVKDFVLIQYVRRVDRMDPEGALAAIPAIKDKRIREDLSRSIRTSGR